MCLLHGECKERLTFVDRKAALVHVPHTLAAVVHSPAHAGVVDYCIPGKAVVRTPAAPDHIALLG